MRNALLTLLVLVANVAFGANPPRVESPNPPNIELLVPAYTCTQGINHARITTNADSGVQVHWFVYNGLILDGENSSAVEFYPMFAGYTIINAAVSYQGTTETRHAALPVFEPPTFVRQPQSLVVPPGTSVTLSAAASDDLVTFDWFEGAAGDTSKLVATGPATFKTPVLTKPTSYWVRVTGRCGAVESQTATVTVEGARRRAAGR